MSKNGQRYRIRDWRELVLSKLHRPDGNDGCWEWQGTKYKDGSNIFVCGPRQLEKAGGILFKNCRAVNAVLAALGREPRHGDYIYPNCGNKKCVNPAHQDFVESIRRPRPNAERDLAIVEAWRNHLKYATSLASLGAKHGISKQRVSEIIKEHGLAAHESPVRLRS